MDKNKGELKGMFESSGVINILSKKEKSSIGAGFFISSEGLILTCLHVLQRGQYVLGEAVSFRFSHNMKYYNAIWINSSDTIDDIAILKYAGITESFYNLISSVGCKGRIET